MEFQLFISKTCMKITPRGLRPPFVWQNYVGIEIVCFVWCASESLSISLVVVQGGFIGAGNVFGICVSKLDLGLIV